MNFLKVNIIAVIVTLLLSCTGNKETESSKTVVQQDNYIDKNRVLVKKDRQAIIGYMNRKNLEMNETKTGLWYQILENGTGKIVETDKLITINYEVRLLDGTLCYANPPDKPKTFLVGKGNVESGLEEGVLLLREGDKVRFLIPPHLAHGHTGDNDKIPPRSILDYRVEVISIQNAN